MLRDIIKNQTVADPYFKTEQLVHFPKDNGLYNVGARYGVGEDKFRTEHLLMSILRWRDVEEGIHGKDSSFTTHQ